MNGIWPERIIKLPYSGHMGATPWLDDTMTELVLRAVGAVNRNLLQVPAVLDEHGVVRMLALMPIGMDGLSADALLLRVTNERPYQDVKLRLSVASYALSNTALVPRDGDFPRELLPDAAGTLLDELVKKLKAIPGLAMSEERW